MLPGFTRRILEEQSSRLRKKRRFYSADRLAEMVIVALPLLINRAKTRRLISYTEVSDVLGLGNAQLANVPFGAITAILRAPELGLLLSSSVPDLSKLVTHKGATTSGEGVFTDHPEERELEPDEQLKFLQSEREKAFTYEHWDSALQLLGLAPWKGVAELP